MSGYIRDREQQNKINRFATYILNLDEAGKKEILAHLPDDFESMEHGDICHCVKRIVESIKKMKCWKSRCCC